MVAPCKYTIIYQQVYHKPPPKAFHPVPLPSGFVYGGTLPYLSQGSASAAYRVYGLGFTGRLLPCWRYCGDSGWSKPICLSAGWCKTGFHRRFGIRSTWRARSWQRLPISLVWYGLPHYKLTTLARCCHLLLEALHRAHTDCERIVQLYTNWVSYPSFRYAHTYRLFPWFLFYL